MKKLILSLVAVLTIGIVTAQEQTTFGFAKDDVIVEGNLKFNSSDAERNFEFTPAVGYFVSDDIALGAQVGFSSLKNKVSDTETKTYALGLFGRYYFLDLGKRFKTYTQGNLGYYDVKDNGNGFGANIGLGINYFVTEHFAINFELANLAGYNSYKPEGGSSSDEFFFNINEFNNFFDENVKFGLTYKF